MVKRLSNWLIEKGAGTFIGDLAKPYQDADLELFPQQVRIHWLVH